MNKKSFLKKSLEVLESYYGKVFESISSEKAAEEYKKGKKIFIFLGDVNLFFIIADS